MKSNLQQTRQANDFELRKQQSLLFVIEDTKRAIDELSTEFIRKPKELTDEELVQMRTNLPSSVTQIYEISKKLESILTKETTIPYIQDASDQLRERYERLTSLKSLYSENLNSEIEERQLYKQKLFSESNLNIEIERFSGYHDSLDFCTFKTKFEKIHLRTTQRHLLADLLKNNYLKDPALSSVKTIDDIDKIWKRLQFAYGDVMIMLQGKMNQLASMNPLNRARDVDATVNLLKKIVNLVKDLTSLVKTHNIENYLYYGGAIRDVPRLLGETRLSRWLGQANDDISPEKTWAKLTKFEDELRIQQQKSIVMSNGYQDPEIKQPRQQQAVHQDPPKTNRNQKKSEKFHWPISHASTIL
eukprot:gene14609-16122_t